MTNDAGYPFRRNMKFLLYINFKKQSTYGKYWVERSTIRDTVWKNLEVITQITEVGQTE